jgi:hypothetical protein
VKFMFILIGGVVKAAKEEGIAVITPQFMILL